VTLRALPVAAGGSGFTIALMTPTRIVDTRNGHGPLTGGNDYVFGPFPVPGSTTFFSDSYNGPLSAIPNFVITQFGPPGAGQITDGKIFVHCGGQFNLIVDVVIDVFVYLVPDV